MEEHKAQVLNFYICFKKNIFMLNFVVLFIVLFQTCCSYNVAGHSYQGVQMLTGERLQIILDKFFNFKPGCFCFECTTWHTNACQHLKLKIQLRFYLIGLSVSQLSLI